MGYDIEVEKTKISENEQIIWRLESYYLKRKYLFIHVFHRQILF